MKFGPSRRHLLPVFVLAFAIIALVNPKARAQPSQGLTATAFIADPGAVLTQNPNGGPQLVTTIRNLAVADPTTLNVILGLLSTASKDQKSAIATGLAQAAKIVIKSNSIYANDIQQAIARTRDQDVVLAFAAASGDQPTGSTGSGAGAGPGGAVGGQTSSLASSRAGGGSAETIGSAGVNTANFSITSSVSGVSNSVSP